MSNSLSLKIHHSEPVDDMPQGHMQQKIVFVLPSERNYIRKESYLCCKVNCQKLGIFCAH